MTYDWSPEAAHDTLAALPDHSRLVLPSLQALQDRFGWVHPDSVGLVAEFLNVSRAEVIGVLTFYSDLRTAPPPAHVLRVCLAEACRAVGAAGIAAALDAAGTVYEPVYCLGNCALGPAAQYDGRLMARCEADLLKGLPA